MDGSQLANTMDAGAGSSDVGYTIQTDSGSGGRGVGISGVQAADHEESRKELASTNDTAPEADYSMMMHKRLSSSTSLEDSAALSRDTMVPDMTLEQKQP